MNEYKIDGEPPEPRYQMLKATVISPQEPGPRLIALVSEQGAATAEPVRRLIDGIDPACEEDRNIRRKCKHQSLGLRRGILMRSPIAAEINYEADGKQTGYLRLLHSVHRSAYGWIPIPIVQIKNGDGPTLLLMAGNHGDEYEGQVASLDLPKTCSLRCCKAGHSFAHGYLSSGC